MKPAVIALALSLLPLTSAFAEVDRKGEFTCHTEDGKKILVNDEFAGHGHALISGARRTYYAIPLDGHTGRLHILMSTGQRAIAAEHTLRLDTANAELTARKEGNEVAQYYFVPAELVTTNLWRGDQVVAAKCLQAVK